MEAPSEDTKKLIQSLRKQRQQFERSGQLFEAEQVNQRLVEIHMNLKKRKRFALRQKQAAVLESIKSTHETEKQKFETSWSDAINKFDANREKILNDLKLRQEKEYADWMNNTFGTCYSPTIFSAELRDLRRIQSCLACQHEYQKAAVIKAKADKMEKLELEINRRRNEANFFVKEKEIKKKLQDEWQVVMKRMNFAREKLQQQCAVNRSKMVQRYNNVNQCLNISHSLERIRMDKALRVPCTYMSRTGIMMDVEEKTQ